MVVSSANNDDDGDSSGSAYIFRNDTFGNTSFFNIEASVDDYRIFNKRLTDAEITDLAAGGNANVLGILVWINTKWIVVSVLDSQVLSESEGFWVG